jgi:hypothetical protein
VLSQIYYVAKQEAEQLNPGTDGYCNEGLKKLVQEETKSYPPDIDIPNKYSEAMPRRTTIIPAAGSYYRVGRLNSRGKALCLRASEDAKLACGGENCVAQFTHEIDKFHRD